MGHSLKPRQIAAFAVCISLSASVLAARPAKERGGAWEYDPGPSASSPWAELFARTPNYRGLGLAVVGDQKFRWASGPMHYRGRLEKGKVKVFVVGQEGAQDESLSNRSFTGSTGTRMQNFLNTIGIDRSYLFMNTFVYPINGQYEEEGIKWLAQSLDSPIVTHRHEMFDTMLKLNQDSLRLVIGVGTAGKASVVTWIQSKWESELDAKAAKKKCPGPQLDSCDASVLGANVRVIGVVHPGGANPRMGGDAQGAVIRTDFIKKFERVRDWILEDSEWLKSDPSMASPTAATHFNYTYAPIPFRDFAFGTMDVLGGGGTTSNRDSTAAIRSTAAGIQLFSEGGCYTAALRIFDEATGRSKCADSDGGRKEPIEYDALSDARTGIPEMPATDYPWEAPRKVPTAFDPGPGIFAKLLSGGESGLGWPDFSALGVTSHPSLGVSSWYRGRFESPQVVVLADQDSTDDLFTGRALTGEGGQRFQAWLQALGISQSYLILRVTPVDVSDLSEEGQLAVALDPEVAAIRDEVLARVFALKKTKLLLAVGPVAEKVLETVESGKVPSYILQSPLKRGFVEQWKNSLTAIARDSAVQIKADSKPTKGFDSGSIAAIPRQDLPFHTKWWVGTSGTRSVRAWHLNSKKEREYMDPNYYRLEVPIWLYRQYDKNSSIPALSTEEAAAVEAGRASGFKLGERQLGAKSDDPEWNDPEWGLEGYPELD